MANLYQVRGSTFLFKGMYRKKGRWNDLKKWTQLVAIPYSLCIATS